MEGVILAMLVMEVGGTHLRAARFDPSSGALFDRRQSPAPNHLTGGDDIQSQVMGALRRLAGDTLGESQPATVAVAYPGPVDSTGTVLATPTLLGSQRGPLRVIDEMARWWPAARVVILNDVAAAGYRYVAGGGRDFCILTIGSGIGNKVFLDGRPVVGPGGRGGELGHLRVDPGLEAPRCDCGDRGHLGGIASGRGCLALVQRAARADPEGAQLALGTSDPQSIDHRALVTAFAEGDPWVRAVLAPAIGYLGWALAGVHLAIGIETFVLVGGFGLAMGEPFRRLVAEAADRSSWRLGQDWDEMVVLGAADDDHGMIGAGLAAAGLVPG